MSAPALLHEASLARTAAALRASERTIDTHLARTRERFEAVEPELEAFVDGTVDFGRLAEAGARLEAHHPDPGERPPLFGLPVGVKDVFHATGFETRAGSAVPPAALAGPEATSVSALREAGALVMGKTVTTEFAFFDPGPTRNPHDPAHTPGGSSSGSAAAVAAGLCPLALGTQTIGSVARPAAFCGVVGVKPSYGRLPIDGVIPVAPSVDHVGFFTQDVPSARLAASVLDPEWGPLSAVEPPQLGAVAGPYLEQAEDRAVAAFEAQLDRLEAAGRPVDRLVAFPDIETVNDRHNELVAAETAISHDEWYPEYGDRYGPELRSLIERGQSVAAGDLAVARAGRAELREQVEAAMDDAGVDVLLSPSAPGPAPEGLDSTGDPVMNLPWTHSGLPTVTLPAGTVDGLPVGLQCAARFGFDERLLAWGEGLAGDLEG